MQLAHYIFQHCQGEPVTTEIFLSLNGVRLSLVNQKQIEVVHLGISRYVMHPPFPDLLQYNMLRGAMNFSLMSKKLLSVRKRQNTSQSRFFTTLNTKHFAPSKNGL